jgi:glycosyl transferase family 25
MNSCKVIIITEPGSRRHDLIAAHLEEKGVAALVSSAVFLGGSDELPGEYDRRTRNRLLGYDLTLGEIGCFMAHRNAWKQVVSLDEVCLILEDDARLRPILTPAALQELAGAIAGTNLIVRLFSQRQSSVKTWRGLPCGLKVVRPSLPGYSAVAYLLSPAAAAALIAHSESFWQTTDDFLDNEAEHGCAVMHAMPETSWHEDEGRSLIGARVKPSIPWYAKARREWLRAGRNILAALHRYRTARHLGLR